MLRTLVLGCSSLCLLFHLSGCDARSAYDVQRDNPLGPSFWIIPVPSDDDGLLARIFPREPDPNRTLEEQSSPNPCADKLQERRDSAMQNRYENAIDTRTTAKTGALLGIYGFGAEVGSATHLVYKVNTTTKISRMDTPEYLECCRERACGWGYVASLVLGDGEYAAATEANAQLQGNYTVVTAGVSRSFAVRQKRQVKGYIAAILVAHDRGAAAQDCPSGKVWAGIECVGESTFLEQEELCKSGNPQASDPAWASNQEMQATFQKQRDDACRWVAAHGGPGTVKPRPAPPTSDPPTPDGTAPPPASAPSFEPGEYVAIGSWWSGKLTLAPDGTFTTSNGKSGVWIFENRKLTLRWADGTQEELEPQAEPGSYANFTGFFRIKKAGGAGAP